MILRDYLFTQQTFIFFPCICNDDNQDQINFRQVTPHYLQISLLSGIT